MRWDGPPLEAWEPWRPDEVARRLAGVDARWCVVGGWAIDLFLGRETRAHDDLEIAVPRADFAAVRAHLAGFALHTVREGEVRALAPDELPPLENHQNWLLDPRANAWRMDVMLEPGEADTWVYRRDESIRAPRARMVARTERGIPFLRPEAVLLFKAKRAEAKDDADLASALPSLDVPARAWLRAALARTHPGHRWLETLASTPNP
jgi:hypothetical protein